MAFAHLDNARYRMAEERPAPRGSSGPPAPEPRITPTEMEAVIARALELQAREEERTGDEGIPAQELIRIAGELGVSITTVSKVLNNHADISEATRSRVLAKVEELGYQRNAVARSLTLRRTHTLGIVIPDLMHSFFVEIIAGIEPVASARGYGLLLWMLLTEAIGPKRHYYGFDSFQGFPAPTAEDGRSAAAVLTHGYYATPEDLVWRVLQDGRVTADARARLTLVRGFFEQTVPSFSEPIALLHLDCDLYESYRTCLVHLYDRVVPGGVIVFDDYGHPRWPGAQRAVDEFFADKRETVITGSTCYLVKA